TFPVGILVMDTMRRHPSDRPALKGQRSAHGQEVFHPFRRFIASMREEPVIAHAYTKASGNPPKQERKCKCFPSEKEQCEDGANVECSYEESRRPVNRLRKCLVTFKDAHRFVLLGNTSADPPYEPSTRNSELL